MWMEGFRASGPHTKRHSQVKSNQWSPAQVISPASPCILPPGNAGRDGRDWTWCWRTQFNKNRGSTHTLQVAAAKQAPPWYSLVLESQAPPLLLWLTQLVSEQWSQRSWKTPNVMSWKTKPNLQALAMHCSVLCIFASAAP